MQHPAIQILFTALITFTLISLILSFSPLLGYLVILAAGVVAVATWMLRYNRSTLHKLYGNPVGKFIIDQVCKLAKEQPPIEPGEGSAPPPVPCAAGASGGGAPPAPPPPPPQTHGQSTASAPPAGSATGTAARGKAAAGDGLLVGDDVDFHLLKENLNDEVRGCSEAIERIVDNLHRVARLRAREAERFAEPPLAIYLLIGPNGIGKRHLMLQFAEHVYKPGAVIALDMREFAGDAGAVQLFGSRQSEGGLILSAVKARPQRVVVLEHLDQADARVVARLQQAFTEGVLIEEATGKRVSFQHCIFLLAMEAGYNTLAAIERTANDPEEFRRKALDGLVGVGALSAPFLALIHEVMCLHPPEPRIRAEVIALLMQSECQRQSLVLEHVDPEILAAEVKTAAGEHGFELARARIRRLLAAPIDEAVRDGRSHVRLTSK